MQALQRICREARDNGGLEQSCCFGPLQSAPSALLQLGVCLKAAALSEPRSITIKSPVNGVHGVQFP